MKEKDNWWKLYRKLSSGDSIQQKFEKVCMDKVLRVEINIYPCAPNSDV